MEGSLTWALRSADAVLSCGGKDELTQPNPRRKRDLNDHRPDRLLERVLHRLRPGHGPRAPGLGDRLRQDHHCLDHRPAGAPADSDASPHPSPDGAGAPAAAPRPRPRRVGSSAAFVSVKPPRLRARRRFCCRPRHVRTRAGAACRRRGSRSPRATCLTRQPRASRPTVTQHACPTCLTRHCPRARAELSCSAGPDRRRARGREDQVKRAKATREQLPGPHKRPPHAYVGPAHAGWEVWRVVHGGFATATLPALPSGQRHELVAAADRRPTASRPPAGTADPDHGRADRPLPATIISVRNKR